VQLLLKVLLIHGVNADTSWQDSVSFVLRPHFEPVKITYRQFQKVRQLSLLGLEGLLRALLLPLGVNAATINEYRMSAMGEVVAQMGRNMGGAPPHILAHSFGTYLTSIIFQRYDWARADRIIFAGAAVAETFPWREVHRQHPLGGNNFNELRNDWFLSDVIIKLASWVRQIPGLGCAGVLGFTMDPGVVHNIVGPGFACSNWQRRGCVPIHNVQRDIVTGADPAALDHSLVYLVPANVALFWLPYLWGLDATEYEDLRALSRGTEEAHRLKDKQTVGRKVQQFLDPARKYSWWPKPLLEHLRDILNSDHYKNEWTGRPENELLGRIPAVLLARMDRAEVTQTHLIANSHRQDFSPDEATWDKVRDLHPNVALCRAIDQILHGS
jgi:pimeloyl-ACP methyl ester carboxylesterase